MNIKAIAPWFGSKRSMAKDIITELGEHKMFVEPACGSMAVVLAKPPSMHELINDLHGDVTNLAWCLQDETLAAWLYARARATLMAEPILTAARERIVAAGPCGDDPDAQRAIDFLVMSWMGRNGEGGLRQTKRSGKIAVRWTPNGGASAVRWRSAAESIPDWHDRLRNVTILRRDAFEVTESIRDESGTAIYWDPPYFEKSDEYEHDFETHNGGLFGDDHTRLAEMLVRFTKARVVVSYYDHPRLTDLYPGWTKRDASRAKHLSNLKGAQRERKTAPEVLMINGDSSA